MHFVSSFACLNFKRASSAWLLKPLLDIKLWFFKGHGCRWQKKKSFACLNFKRASSAWLLKPLLDIKLWLFKLYQPEVFSQGRYNNNQVGKGMFLELLDTYPTLYRIMRKYIGIYYADNLNDISLMITRSPSVSTRSTSWCQNQRKTTQFPHLNSIKKGTCFVTVF